MKNTFPDYTLYNQIVEALQSLRPVYITDGTVTRLVTTVEYLDDEVRCTLDDRSRFLFYPGFEQELETVLKCIETDDGFFLSPDFYSLT